MPNEVDVFGSSRYVVNVNALLTCSGAKSQILHIKKSHLKAVDQPSSRCRDESSGINASACIANYIERELGCNPSVYGSKYSKGLPCTTKDQLLRFDLISQELSGSNDHDIYNKTGCSPLCDRNVYSIIADPMTCWDDYYYNEFQLLMRITDRTYEERTQYIIYDTDSFIADVGGYMGLLLGYSIMSLYVEIESLLKRMIRRFFFCININNKH